jgi:hypothetical protein
LFVAVFVAFWGCFFCFSSLQLTFVGRCCQILLCSSCFASRSGFSIEKNIMVGMLMDMLPSACAVLVSFAISVCNCSLP